MSWNVAPVVFHIPSSCYLFTSGSSSLISHSVYFLCSFGIINLSCILFMDQKLKRNYLFFYLFCLRNFSFPSLFFTPFSLSLSFVISFMIFSHPNSIKGFPCSLAFSLRFSSTVLWPLSLSLSYPLSLILLLSPPLFLSQRVFSLLPAVYV